MRSLLVVAFRHTTGFPPGCRPRKAPRRARERGLAPLRPGALPSDQLPSGPGPFRTECPLPLRATPPPNGRPLRSPLAPGARFPRGRQRRREERLPCAPGPAMRAPPPWPRVLALRPLRCLARTPHATPLRHRSAPTGHSSPAFCFHSPCPLRSPPPCGPAPPAGAVRSGAWCARGLRAVAAGSLGCESLVGRGAAAWGGKQPREALAGVAARGISAAWSPRLGAGITGYRSPLSNAPPAAHLVHECVVRARRSPWTALFCSTLAKSGGTRPSAGSTLSFGHQILSAAADMGAKKRRGTRPRSKGAGEEEGEQVKEEEAVQQAPSGDEGTEEEGIQGASRSAIGRGRGRGRGKGRGAGGARKQEKGEAEGGKREAPEKGSQGEGEGEGAAGVGEGPAKGRPAAKGAKGKTAKQALAEAKEVEALAGRSAQPWTVLVHRKPQEGWAPYDPATMRPPLKDALSGAGSGEPGRVWRLLSWNVNGLRALLKSQLAAGDPPAAPIPAWAKGKGRKRKGGGEGESGEGSGGEEGEGGKSGDAGKGGVTPEVAAEAHALQVLAEREQADVICLQETKIQKKDCEALQRCLEPHFAFCHWNCSESKLGYSGTAILSKHKPLSVRVGLGRAEHDGEGRVVAVEFPGFYLVTAYVPNSGEGLKRLSYREKEWDPALSDFLKRELEPQKPVILTGDLNVAHQEIDIFHPEGNRRSAGFTDEERQSFEANFLSKGLVDTFRRQHPDTVAYTYWGYRSKARPENRGWRLDYFLVSESLAPRVLDSYILPDVDGSDHCPIGLILRAP